MKRLRRLSKDRVSGVVLLVLGLAIVAQGLEYRMGTLTHMGAGFVPVVLGILLALVGVAIWITAEPGDFGTAESMPTEWRGWLCVLGGVFAFVVFGQYGGLVPASFISVFIAAMGDRSNSVRTAALLAAGITVAGVVIFVYGLGMTFPLFTWG
ncbi:MAG: tripartite tricarboxylate transporter TctB family protein [Caldimonas sp.]